jgi:hypothetical protein
MNKSILEKGLAQLRLKSSFANSVAFSDRSASGKKHLASPLVNPSTAETLTINGRYLEEHIHIDNRVPRIAYFGQNAHRSTRGSAYRMNPHFERKLAAVASALLTYQAFLSPLCHIAYSAEPS